MIRTIHISNNKNNNFNGLGLKAEAYRGMANGQWSEYNGRGKSWNGVRTRVQLTIMADKGRRLSLFNSPSTNQFQYYWNGEVDNSIQ